MLFLEENKVEPNKVLVDSLMQGDTFKREDDILMVIEDDFNCSIDAVVLHPIAKSGITVSVPKVEMVTKVIINATYSEV